MKSSLPLGLAIALAAIAIGAFVWTKSRPSSVSGGGNLPSPATNSATSTTGSPASLAGSPGTTATATASAPSTQHPAGGPPVIASSVVPGSPMVRGGINASAPANPPAPVVPPLRVGNPEARADIQNVSLMFRDFRTRMGGNPVGANAEIMKAIMGGNPAQGTFGPPPGQALNDKGELVDRWGTPYFFHQLSKNNMEIRSAGPDKIMWNNDDIVGR